LSEEERKAQKARTLYPATPSFLRHQSAPQVSCTISSCLCSQSQHIKTAAPLFEFTPQRWHIASTICFLVSYDDIWFLFTAEEKRRHPWNVPLFFVLHMISSYGQSGASMAPLWTSFGRQRTSGHNIVLEVFFGSKKERGC
jgi:hypothetical protein